MQDRIPGPKKQSSAIISLEFQAPSDAYFISPSTSGPNIKYR